MTRSPNRGGRRTLCALIAAAAFVGPLATHAAAEDAKIKEATFSIQPVYQGDEIVVTSSDGKKWDTIDAKALKLSATMKVDTKHPGYVSQVGILLGGCHNTGCANNPTMYYKATSTRDYHANRVFNFPGHRIPVSTSGIAVPSYGDEILKSCNNHLQADGATKSYSFNKLLTASFSANTRKAAGSLPPVEVEGPGGGQVIDFNGGDVTRQAQFKVKVTCKAHEFKVKSVDLKINVMPAEFGQKGSCPAIGHLAVNIPTNRGGKVKFMLYRDDGAKQTVVASSTPVPNDASGKSFRAYWHKYYDLKKSVNRKYMVVVIGHKYSTPWTPMVLKCGAKHDAAGPGGVVSKPRPQTDSPANKRPAVIVTPRPRPRPKMPLIKVAPLPQVACIGGKVARGQCFCPGQTKKITVAPNRHRCVNSVTRESVKPKANTVLQKPLLLPNQLRAIQRSPLRVR